MQDDTSVILDKEDPHVQRREKSTFQLHSKFKRSRMNIEFPVYHVLVVGFHHKKGCQVEYTYPPLETEIENTAWKHLPTLAMPDGAHNFDKDTVYFHLPSLKNSNETVFGVACYQQIDSKKLKNKPDDVTRSTVQKSVCVLSRFPLYGHIQVKMSLITAAYFREGDFDQVSILEEAFHNLNACLTKELLCTPEAFVGLSPRELIFTFRHQVLLLFKLLLLEKRVLFRGGSVGPLCSCLLTLVSLFPCALEYGLNQSACIKSGKHHSIVPQFSEEEVSEMTLGLPGSNGANTIPGKEQNLNRNYGGPDEIDSNRIEGNSRPEKHNSEFYVTSKGSPISPSGVLYTSGPAEGVEIGDVKSEEVPDFLIAVQLSPADAGLPLSLFVKGNICHPYLSLHYLDLLSDSSVRGFLVGATNVLFKHKRDLVDVIVEMQDGSIEIIDPNLRRQLTLTTPDLRFAENLVKQVTQDGGPEGDSFMDGVGWEGGDEWIRAQFKYYLMCLMRTSLAEEGNGKREFFGASYLGCWQNTYNWRLWNEYVNSDKRDTPGVYALCPGHPCEGSMSVSDMKIRLAHTMQNTEGGRRLNQAVANTGKAFGQTGKAVGGALTTAKGALSSWWNTVTTPTSPPDNPPSGGSIENCNKPEETENIRNSTSELRSN